MRELPFHHEPQITALVYAYRKQLKDDPTGPEGTVGEYADKLASLSYDELLDRLLVACPDKFGEIGLNYLPAGERLQRLMGLAAGDLRGETHWPLIGDFFDSLRSRSQDYVVDFEAASEAIITAFNQRLTAEQQERVRADLIHEFEFADVAEGKRLSPRYIHFTPSGEYYSAWMLHVLGTTVGKLSDLVYPRWLTRPGAINQMLGSTRMHSVMLTLDFRVDARQYWEPTSDNVVDPLGACLYAGPDSPQIVLFLHAIARAAEELERPYHVHELGQLVFLHEFAHLVHLGRSDLDGLLNPAAPEPWSRQDWVELVSQLFTWSAIKDDAKLAALFEKLTDISPPAYQTWRTLTDCSLEDFRAYLWLLRRNGAGKNGLAFQEWFCAEHSQLPPLPKPQDHKNPSQRQP
ncbi:MAG: hypothetical protein ABMA26_07170 [Limisphaerales bacterium]